MGKVKRAAGKRPVRGILHLMLRRATRMDDQAILDFLRLHKIEDATVDDIWEQAVATVMTDLGHPDLVAVAKRLRKQPLRHLARRRPFAASL